MRLELNDLPFDPGGALLVERAVVTHGDAEMQRWSRSGRAGAPEAVVDLPPQHCGLAARGALVEAGWPEFQFALSQKLEIWSEDAPRICAQAAASQWDPATAISRGTPFELPGDVEDAVVQLMTYLIENETAV